MHQTLWNAPKHEFRVQWSGSGAFVVKNLDTISWDELLHYLNQMQRNTMKHTKTWFQGPMGWIGCIRCEKFGHDFVAWTFALIAPVQPILHRVSSSNEMVPDAPKHYEMQQKMSLGSNGFDWVRSLWKHQTRLCGTNFWINCTSSANFAPSLLS